MATAFEQSNPSWNGHCWISFGDCVGDLSVFRTAYSSQAPQVLQQVVLERFGPDKGLLLSSVKAAAERGLTYVPRYVLTETQLNGLLLGVPELFGFGPGAV